MVNRGKTVRQLAFEIAHKADRTDYYLEDLTDKALDGPDGQALDERDRRLLRELVLGSCRRQVTLDHLIAHFSSRPIARIDPEILTLLRQALYQVIYLDRVPEHAAVDEAVELAKRTGSQGQAGFVNGLLRAVVRSMTSEGASQATLPTGSRLVHFADAIVPDPAEDLPGYLSVIGSMPRLVVERRLDRFSANVIQQMSDAANTVPTVFVHPNGLRTDADGLRSALAAEGRKLHDAVEGRFYRLEPTDRIAELSAFSDGLFWVMDPASAHAVTALEVEPGQRVLDLCAAPGAKTALICEFLGNTGEVAAVDASSERMRRLGENIRRLRLSIVSKVVADGREVGRIVGGQFDRVLADVPCSNSGVFGRRVQARHRLSPERLGQLSRLQEELLSAGAGMLRAGGKLVYSTCSVEPEENEGVVDAVLGRDSSLELAASRTHLPEAGVSDGGFVAVIAKTGAEG